MTVYFASHEIQIYRHKSKGNDKYAYSATGTVAQADIQPMSESRIELVGGRIGKTYVGYVDSSVDVKEGDQIHANGKKYGVQTVSKWEGAGLLDHIEIVLNSQDA